MSLTESERATGHRVFTHDEARTLAFCPHIPCPYTFARDDLGKEVTCPKHGPIVACKYEHQDEHYGGPLCANRWCVCRS